MKYLISSILIISFVGIAILGFTIFDYSMHNSNSDCITSTINGTACPTSIMGMALHHISILQTFTTIVVPSSFNRFLLLVSLFFISISISLFCKDLLFPKLKSLYQRLQDLILHSSYSKQRIIFWLSLLEFSPTL